MKNVLDKYFGENKEKFFMFNNIFPKIVPFRR